MGNENKIDWYKSLVLLISSGIAAGVLNFYIEWKSDEATEDALMFDNAAQKQRHENHVNSALTPEEQRVKVLRDEDFQKAVLEELRKIEKKQDRYDSINLLNADQVYQIKNELKTIKNQ